MHCDLWPIVPADSSLGIVVLVRHQSSLYSEWSLQAHIVACRQRYTSGRYADYPDSEEDALSYMSACAGFDILN